MTEVTQIQMRSTCQTCNGTGTRLDVTPEKAKRQAELHNLSNERQGFRGQHKTFKYFMKCLECESGFVYEWRAVNFKGLQTFICLN